MKIKNLRQKLKQHLNLENHQYKKLFSLINKKPVAPMITGMLKDLNT